MRTIMLIENKDTGNKESVLIIISSMNFLIFLYFQFHF